MDEGIIKYMSVDNGVLTLDGHRLLDYIDGNPVYIVHIDTIKDNLSRLVSTGVGEVRYAVKALSRPRVLNLIRSMGLGLEVVSIYELEKALRIGFDPGRIIYNGLGKDRSIYKYLFKLGVEAINIDSEYEFKLYTGMDGWREFNWGFRLNLGVGKKVLDTSSETSKFGLEVDRVMDLVDRYRVGRMGLHLHIGSQISDINVIVEAIQKLRKVIDMLESRGVDITYLDIGGGIPKNYLSAPIDIPIEGEIDISLFKPNYTLDEWARLVKNHLGRYRIYVEPGRYVVADSTILLSKVVGVKDRLSGVRWIYLNIGVNYVTSQLIYKWYYPMVNVSKSSQPHNHPFRVGGILCDSDDIFHDYEGEKVGMARLPRYRHLPSRTSPGDVIALLHVGAYNIEGFMRYNSHPDPIVRYV